MISVNRVGLEPLPVREAILLLFISHQSKKKKQHHNI